MKLGRGWVVAVSLRAAGTGQPRPLAACPRAAPAAGALPVTANPVGHGKPRYADAAAVKLLIFAEDTGNYSLFVGRRERSVYRI